MSDTSTYESIIKEYQAELANEKHLAINYKVLYEEIAEKLQTQESELQALRQEIVNQASEGTVPEPEVITTVE